MILQSGSVIFSQPIGSFLDFTPRYLLQWKRIEKPKTAKVEYFKKPITLHDNDSAFDNFVANHSITILLDRGEWKKSAGRTVHASETEGYRKYRLISH